MRLLLSFPSRRLQLTAQSARGPRVTPPCQPQAEADPLLASEAIIAPSGTLKTSPRGDVALRNVRALIER